MSSNNGWGDTPDPQYNDNDPQYGYSEQQPMGSQGDYTSGYENSGAQPYGAQGGYENDPQYGYSEQQPMGNQGDYTSGYGNDPQYGYSEQQPVGSQETFASAYGAPGEQPIGSQGQQPVGSQGPLDYSPTDFGNGPYGQGGVPGGGSSEKNFQGIIALATGIGGLFISILGIVAVIFGFLGLKSVKEGRANNKGIAIAGLVIGFFDIFVMIASMIVAIAIFIGVANLGEISVNPNNEPTSQQGQGSEGKGKGKKPKTGSLNATAEDATLIATANGFEIRTVLAEGKLDEYATAEDLRGKDIVVVKFFVKNTSDKAAKFGYASYECTVDGNDCSKEVFGLVNDQRLDGLYKLSTGEYDPDQEVVATSGLPIEASKLEDAKISLKITTYDGTGSEPKVFPIK